MKVFFYVQHLLGIGHLARASLIARQLVASGAEVVMALGGKPVLGFPGEGINVLQLPPIAAGPEGFAELVDADGQPIDDEFRDTRRDTFIAEFNAFQPDVLLVEAFPFGRRQVRFELLPLLEVAKAHSRPPIVACSLRDILQHRSMKRHRETLEIANCSFDAILVHGDPALVRLEETFPLVGELKPQVIYTGIVSETPGELSGKSYDVVVSAGGGVVGGALMRCALEARPQSAYASDSWCFLVGPNLDVESRSVLQAGAGDGVVVENARPDFRALLKTARLSISQAGYNTMADVLQAGCRSLVVPFAAGGESEQSLRAERLAALGVVTSLCEEELSPQTLLAALDATATAQYSRASLDLEGATRTAAALSRLVSSGR